MYLHNSDCFVLLMLFRSDAHPAGEVLQTLALETTSASDVIIEKEVVGACTQSRWKYLLISS